LTSFLCYFDDRVALAGSARAAQINLSGQEHMEVTSILRLKPNQLKDVAPRQVSAPAFTVSEHHRSIKTKTTTGIGMLCIDLQDQKDAIPWIRKNKNLTLLTFNLKKSMCI
jgi:hypothetical protein